jgi:phosphinothricin acetyltransferase
VQLVLDLPENQPHRADLAKLLVPRRARRQGLGTGLIRAAESWARECGKTLLVLDAVTGGDAARLYQCLGWVQVGDIPGYALMPGGEICSTTVFYRDLETRSDTENRGFRILPERQATEGNIRVIDCDESFSEAILSIINHAISNSVALYDYKPRTLDSMAAWFAAKRKGSFPVIGAVSDKGELLGFASYGGFRAWPAYKYSAEHSVYVSAAHRGKGIGKRLLQSIIDEARHQSYHVLIGGIDSQNTASVALHKSLGFQRAGTIRQVGFKFQRWLDLDFYQLILETPACPVEE